MTSHSKKNFSFQNALVSCSDKTGLADFLKPLQRDGLRIVSTGGTANYLREAGLKVVDVSEQTGFQEVMDGRVKTLHPKIHMALLAREGNAEDTAVLHEYGIEAFDLVVGNLYPFESAPSVEKIDIGGPSFLRSASKNFERITVLCDPADYGRVLEKPEGLTLEDRRQLAAKVFAHTSAYDAMISRHFAGDSALDFRDYGLGGEHVKALRYGENPQQKAAWFRIRGERSGLHQARILQGKELSYNNLIDLEAAIATVREFSSTPNRLSTCVAVKHNSPCGVARSSNPAKAAELAIAADSQSVFGGIVAMDFKLDVPVAEIVTGLFLECVVAPDLTREAAVVLSKKKNLRVLIWPELTERSETFRYRSISGGFLVQTADQVESEWSESWRVIGEAPSEQIRQDLLFAWQVCAHLKSNAIAITRNSQTLGLGMGQVNRVDAVENAISRMRRFHKNTNGAVLASDAFFPFADSIDLICEAGIQYIIQPGGSVKDEEVIARAKEKGLTMVLTGRRHFAH